MTTVVPQFDLSFMDLNRTPTPSSRQVPYVSTMFASQKLQHKKLVWVNLVSVH